MYHLYVSIYIWTHVCIDRYVYILYLFINSTLLLLPRIRFCQPFWFQQIHVYWYGTITHSDPNIVESTSGWSEYSDCAGLPHFLWQDTSQWVFIRESVNQMVWVYLKVRINFVYRKEFTCPLYCFESWTHNCLRILCLGEIHSIDIFILTKVK